MTHLIPPGIRHSVHSVFKSAVRSVSSVPERWGIVVRGTSRRKGRSRRTISSKPGTFSSKRARRGSGKKRLGGDEENVPAGRETISGDEKRAVQKTSESDGRILRERNRAERRRRRLGEAGITSTWRRRRRRRKKESTMRSRILAE